VRVDVQIEKLKAVFVYTPDARVKEHLVLSLGYFKLSVRHNDGVTPYCLGEYSGCTPHPMIPKLRPYFMEPCPHADPSINSSPGPVVPLDE